VTNCGELVLHGGAHVYNPLINPCGDHEIWSGVLQPGQSVSFDRTYTVKESDLDCGCCGGQCTLTNTATAVGHPRKPDGTYLPDVTDVASWTVNIESGWDRSSLAFINEGWSCNGGDGLRGGKECR